MRSVAAAVQAQEQVGLVSCVDVGSAAFHVVFSWRQTVARDGSNASDSDSVSSLEMRERLVSVMASEKLSRIPRGTA